MMERASFNLYILRGISKSTLFYIYKNSFL